MSTIAKTRIAKPPIVGTSVFRKEGVDKLLGRARYVDDLEREGMWHGATVRSTIPRGVIRSIHFDPCIDWTEFTVVTAFDIPGRNQIHLIFDDQPCLADEQVNHCDEAILLLAHPSRQKLREAAAAIRIDYDPLPARLHHRRERTPGRNHLGRRQPPQKLPPRKGRCRFGMGQRRAHR